MSSPLIRNWLGGGSRGAAGGGAAPVTDFVFTVQTTGTPETFTIPCRDIGTFNANINWGDGEPDSTVVLWNEGTLAHSYATPGTYTITISDNPGVGGFPTIYFNSTGDAAKVRTVENLGIVGWENLVNAFFGCTGMTSFTAGNCDTSAVSSWAKFLMSTTSCTTVNLSGLDTSSAININSFIQDNPATSLDVSMLDVSSVTTMNSALRSTSATDIDISGWNISSLTSASSLMLQSQGMTTPVYDATLIAWEAQNVPNVIVHFGLLSKYTGAPSAAATAHADLGTNGWTITDGGFI